jgi:predicted phosphodiesterase
VRVALISDLHGNEIALRAVRDEIDHAGVDEIVCLGDVATLGPRPREVIDILRERGCACIMGNHDEFLVDPTLVQEYSREQPVIDAVDWCRDTLASDELDFVANFERTRRVPLDDHSTLFLFHGSPSSNMTDIVETTHPEDLDRMLSGHTATVMAGGHTHIQMVRHHRDTVVVNPGSVGLAFKDYAKGKAPTLLPQAEYATIESVDGRVRVGLHRVVLDAYALCEAAEASDLPMRDLLVAQYR